MYVLWLYRLDINFVLALCSAAKDQTPFDYVIEEFKIRYERIYKEFVDMIPIHLYIGNKFELYKNWRTPDSSITGYRLF